MESPTPEAETCLQIGLIARIDEVQQRLSKLLQLF